MKRIAAIYARLSSDRDLNAASIQDQIDACKAEADRRGFEVPDNLVFVDRNLSASKRGTVRPAYNQLLDVLEKGITTTVFVRETSRLYRQPAELERLLELVEGKGVKVHALFSGEIDLDRGLLEARIRVAVDAEESHKLSQRVKLAKAARRAEGSLNGGGRRPYGYQRTPGGLVIEPTEAVRIKEATQRILAGEPMNRLVTDWNEQGITTAGGGRWTPSRLKRILVGGVAQHRETPLIGGGSGWDAILSADEVALLKARLTAPSKHRPKDSTPSARKYPLTGLTICELCDRPLIGSGGYYRCASIQGGCGHVSITARSLESHLLQRIDNLRAGIDIAGNAQPDASPPMPNADEQHRAALLAKLRDLEDRLAEVGEAIASGDLSIQSGAAAEAGLIERHNKVTAELALTGPAAPPARSWDELVADAEDWHERWTRGELTASEVLELHDMFAAWLKEARISPRRDRRKRFDPDRVRIEWREGVLR